MVRLIITGAFLAIGFMAWKIWKLKKDIYYFTDSLEQNLDRLLSGEELEYYEDIQDSLLGKINEKLGRIAQVWKRKEGEIKAEKKQIEELVSDISHQTKTPIANQKIYLEILCQEVISEKGREVLEKLEGQTDKLEFLLQGMIKTSRLETGTIRIQKQSVNLMHTLQRAIETIVPSAVGKKILLSVDCQADFKLAHDHKWTGEALFNILENAVKYTDEGGSIHITLVRQELFSKISIKDSGKGIAPERQAEIFTRFYREPEAHSQPGIGIGLYLARKIIEIQGGYIEVRSEQGKGSDFQIYLPNDK